MILEMPVDDLGGPAQRPGRGRRDVRQAQAPDILEQLPGGPLDPQVGNLPAASILEAVTRKDAKDIDDQTLILADVAAKARRQVQSLVQRILAGNGWDAERARALAEALTDGRWTHDYPITVDEARELGLPVSTAMPAEVYRFMQLFPQPGARRPSVEYVPAPYPAPSRTAPRRD